MLLREHAGLPFGLQFDCGLPQYFGGEGGGFLFGPEGTSKGAFSCSCITKWCRVSSIGQLPLLLWPLWRSWAHHFTRSCGLPGWLFSGTNNGSYWGLPCFQGASLSRCWASVDTSAMSCLWMKLSLIISFLRSPCIMYYAHRFTFMLIPVLNHTCSNIYNVLDLADRGTHLALLDRMVSNFCPLPWHRGMLRHFFLFFQAVKQCANLPTIAFLQQSRS